MARKKSVYKVVFVNQGKVYEIYAKNVSHGGLFGFVDTGRVFYAGESSNRWHTGYGGGIWIAPLLRQLTLSLAVAGSDEGTRIYVALGMGY